MGNLDSSLFIAAWVLALISWVLGIIEWIGWLRFWPASYRLGIRVLRESRPLPLIGLGQRTQIETQDGRLQLVSPEMALFRRKRRYPGATLHTPFPLKGCVRWEGANVAIEGRIPLFPVVFMGLSILAFVVIDAPFRPEAGSGGGSILSALIVVTFVALIGIVSIPYERRQAMKVLDGIEADLQESVGLTSASS